MYGVMIIDDDEEIRLRLRSIIDWNSLGLFLSCEAGDSDTSLELFELTHPKIIVTDINIPIISGIALAEEFYKIDSEIKIIIITGYNDFDYVKSSVKLGAVDLISKPITAEEINSSLKAAVNQFEELRKQKTTSDELISLLDDSKAILQEQHVSRILNTTSEKVSQNERFWLKKLGFNINKKNYAVAIAAPDISRKPWEDIDLLLAAIKNIGDELLTEAGFDVYSYFNDASTVIFLIGWDIANRESLLERTLLQLSKKMQFYFDEALFAGIGGTVKEITCLSESYREAQVALNYQGILKCSPVVNIHTVHSLDFSHGQDIEEIISTVVGLFKNSRMKELTSFLNERCAQFDPTAHSYLEELKEFSFAYLSALISASAGISIGDGYGELFSRIASLNNVQAVCAVLLSATEELMDKTAQRCINTQNYLIEAAKAYIREHLQDENLNLDTVSAHIGLSRDYFCSLFHKEVGITFSAWLNNERIEKAKKLLRSTILKSFEVSYKVGYSNPKHFNYVFKRLTGLTPLEYKNSNLPEIKT